MSRFVDTPEDFIVYPPNVIPPAFTLLDEEDNNLQQPDLTVD